MKKLILFLGLFIIGLNLLSQDAEIDVLTLKDSMIQYKNSTFTTLIIPQNDGTAKYKNGATPIVFEDLTTKGYVDALLAGLNLTEFDDPTANEATSTAVIDTTQGVLVTLTTTGVDQVMQQPTDKRRRRFVFMNDNSSVANITVSFDSDNESALIPPGFFYEMVYDSVEWLGSSIASIATINLNGTGLSEGGLIDTITGDATTFNISAGDGFIIDNVTDHEKPIVTPVSWDDILDIPMANIGTVNISRVAIDITGSVVQQSTNFTSSQSRTLIEIGNVGSANNLTITAYSMTPNLTFNRALDVSDLASAIGSINAAGNVFSGSVGDLNLDKSSGKTYRKGINHGTDDTSPSITTDPLLTSATIIYGYRNGAGKLTFDVESAVIPGMYDDGSGTLQAVSSNDFSIQLGLYFAGSNTLVVLYGQTVYNTFTDAKAGLADPFEIPADILTGATQRTKAILKQNLASFSDPLTDGSTFEFIALNRFGDLGGGASATATDLQQAYNNSVQPQIATNSGLGALQIKSGTGNDSDNIQEWLNNAGTVTASVDGRGFMSIDGDFDLGGGDLTSTNTNATIFTSVVTDITIGNTGSDIFLRNNVEIEGDLEVDNIFPSSNGIYDLGSTLLKWNNIYTEELVVTANGIDIIGETTTQDIVSQAGSTFDIGSLTNGYVDGYCEAIKTHVTTASLYDAVVTTLDIGGASTATNIGAATGTTTIGNDLEVRGNLGVGTSTPQRDLVVHDATNAVFQLTNNTSGVTNVDGLLINIVGVDVNISNQEAGVMEFGTNGTNAISISSSQNVDFTSLGTGAVFSNAGVLTNSDPSSASYKENIVDMPNITNKMMQTRPVGFVVKTDSTRRVRAGFIAGYEEGEFGNVFPNQIEAIDSTHYGIKTTEIVALNTKFIQEVYTKMMNRTISLNNKVDSLEFEYLSLRSEFDTFVESQGIKDSIMNAKLDSLLSQ
jgi:hypothetical protein